MAKPGSPRPRLHVVLDAAIGAEQWPASSIFCLPICPARLHRRIVHVGCPTVDHIARPDCVLQRRRIIGVEGVFHCVEVIEVAKYSSKRGR